MFSASNSISYLINLFKINRYSIVRIIDLLVVKRLNVKVDTVVSIVVSFVDR